MNDTEESLDLILSVILDDEPACQITHLETVCTVHVTHLFTGCTRTLLMCDVATARKREQIASGRRCSQCQRRVGACWKVRPI